MECLRFHTFFNNVMALPEILENGVNTRRGKIIRMCYQRTTEVIVLVGVLAQFRAIPIVWADMNVLCGCLASGTHSIQILFKTIYLNYYKKDFIRYLKRIDEVENLSTDFEQKYLKKRGTFTKYYSKQMSLVRCMLISHFTVSFFSTSAYFLPFVYDSIVHHDNVENKLTPIVIYLSFDFNWTPLFQTVIALLTICFYLNNLKTVVVDNFMLGMIVVSMAHFRYQKELLRSTISKYCSEGTAGSSQIPEFPKISTADEKVVLREWIVLHQKLLKATCHFGRLLSPYLFLEFFYILVHTCVPAFVITSTFSWTAAQKTAVFLIVGGGLVQLFLMCIVGDAFGQAWETVDSDLFRLNLYRKEEKWKFHFFMMQRLKSPFRFSAYKLFPLSSSTFAAISRLVVSHYMTLNQIQTLKTWNLSEITHPVYLIKGFGKGINQEFLRGGIYLQRKLNATFLSNRGSLLSLSLVMAEAKKFDFCYQYFHFYSKFNNLVGLPLFVSRDFHLGSRLSIGFSYFYEFISELWVFLGFISGVIALTIVWNDVNILFGCVSSTTHMAQILFKIILLNWKKNKFMQQLRRLNSIFERNELLKIDDVIPGFGNFTSVTLRRLKNFEFIVMTVITIWTSVYFIPFMYKSIINYDYIGEANIPIVGFIPFNYTVSPRYQLVVIFQCILFYFNNLKTVAIDYFILGFIVIHILQFRYLNLTLARVTELLINKQEDGEEVDPWINSFMVNWIKQHQDTICAVKNSVDLLSLYFLVEFGYIVIHTCVPAFVITSTLSWNLNQKIVLVFMCTSSIVNLYLLALSGDIFSESNEEFGITFYGPHLFETNRSYKLIYRMLLYIGRNRSKVFGFSNVYPLCSITFGAIMRMVMSCYLALNQIKGFRNEV